MMNRIQTENPAAEGLYGRETEETVVMDMPVTVVYPDNALPVEAAAAEELARFLGKITGTVPVLLKEGKYLHGSAFFVNTKRSAFSCGKTYMPETLGEEGTFYSVDKQGVYLGGSSVRGILYSVYTFLEEELGCHRYAEDCEVIPHADTLTLTKKTRSYVPQMLYRGASFADGDDADFCVFNKLNANTGIPAEHGGTVEFGIGFVHTLPKLVPDELFAEHPEYFPEIGGIRECGSGHQRCLTNPEVLKMTVDAVKAEFRSDPHIKIASVSQADTGEIPYSCTCPACRAVNDEEGSLMGTQLRFVNAVADAVREEFPDRYIETLAYRFTRHVCRKTVPRDNVIIRLCSIECCFSHPLALCPENADFVKDMKDWAAIAKNIHIWDYVADFSNYIAPYPNLGVLADNMRFYVGNHAVGMYAEGAYNSRGSDMSELKAWLLAKLQWNPDFDAEKGTEQFINGYFGSAAEPMLSYVKLLTARAAEADVHYTCYTGPDRKFFTEEFMALAESYFEKAKECAENDVVLTRVRRWEIPVRYVKMAIRYDTFTSAALDAEIRSFMADVTALGVDKPCEWSDFAPTEEALRYWGREVLAGN